MPLISVIVPVYNVESYLHRCIDSVLSQTFMNFELILVDDGSPDKCPIICDEYVLQDNRVHVIHQENGGLSAARNSGIDWAFENSNSQWISFIDSDDWVHPQYLELLYKYANEENADASVCAYSNESEYKPSSMIKAVNCQNYGFEEYFCLKQAGLNRIVAWGKLYKKDLFINKRYPVGKINEDLFTTPKVLYDCARIAVIDTCLYYYFQSEGSIMRKPWNTSRLDGIEASKELIRFLHKKRLVKAEERAVKGYLWVLSSQREEIKALQEKDKQNEKRLDRLYKKELIRYRRYLPKNEFNYKFDLEFPKLTWIYWTIVGIKKR